MKMTEPLEVLTMPRAPSDHPEGSTEWLIAQLNSADDIDVMVAERLRDQADRIAALEAALTTAQEQARMASFMGEGYALVEARAVAAEAERDRLRRDLIASREEIRHFRGNLDVAMDDVADLRNERDRLFGLLMHWQSYGCPACGGDCSAANPHVVGCLMQETAAALQPRAALVKP
jgi:hypothetical protein